jgi:hypothetical protein
VVKRPAALLLALAIAGAHAAEPEALIRRVAGSGINLATSRDGKSLQLVSLGSLQACAGVAEVSDQGAIRNFRVCDGAVTEREQPVPSWNASEASRAFVHRVVLLARRYGFSSGLDDQGYRIRVKAQGPVGAKCQNFELQVLADEALTHWERLRDCS